MSLREELVKYVPYNEQEENDKKVMIDFIDTFDNYLIRENEFGHFTASSWIVNKDRTKVLMIHHNIYNSWAWTGGHADGDDDLKHVALKEANEETGLDNFKLLSEDIFSLEILTVDGHVKRGKYVPSHLHLNVTFLIEADENEVIRIKEDENSDIKWIDIEEASVITNEEKMRPIYRKLNEKLKEYK